MAQSYVLLIIPVMRSNSNLCRSAWQKVRDGLANHMGRCAVKGQMALHGSFRGGHGGFVRLV